MVTAEVRLDGPDWQLQTKMTVPAGPTRLIEILPLAQALADAVVDVAVKSTNERGDTISCTGSPAKSGAPSMIANRMKLGDGREIRS